MKLFSLLLMYAGSALAVPLGFNNQDTINYGLVCKVTCNGNITDWSGYGTTVNATNGVTYAGGPMGGSVGFNGIQSAAGNIITIQPISAMTTAFSVGCWVKPTAYDSAVLSSFISSQIDSFGNAETTVPYTHLYLGEAGANNFWYSFSNGATTRVINSTPSQSLATNAWDFVIMTYNGTTLNCYIDSTNANSISASGNLINSTNQIYIGGSGVLSWNTMSGNIADALFYNRALSAAEIQQLYNGGYGSP